MGNRQPGGTAHRSRLATAAATPPPVVAVSEGQPPTTTDHGGHQQHQQVADAVEPTPPPTLSPRQEWQLVQTTVGAVQAFEEPLRLERVRAQQRRERQAALERDPTLFFAAQSDATGPNDSVTCWMQYTRALLLLANHEYGEAIPVLRVLSSSETSVATDAKYQLAVALIAVDSTFAVHGDEVAGLLQSCTRDGVQRTSLEESLRWQARQLMAHTHMARGHCEEAKRLLERYIQAESTAAAAPEIAFQVANCAHQSSCSLEVLSTVVVDDKQFHIDGSIDTVVGSSIAIDAAALLAGPQ